MALTTKNARGVSTEYWSAFSIYYCPLSIPNTLSALTVLPVVRSAPHGRRMPFPSPYLSPITPTLLFLSLSYYTITIFLPHPNLLSTTTYPLKRRPCARVRCAHGATKQKGNGKIKVVVRNIFLSLYNHFCSFLSPFFFSFSFYPLIHT